MLLAAFEMCRLQGEAGDSRVAALRAFPRIKVVQPVYHSLDGIGGHGSFCESGRCRLS